MPLVVKLEYYLNVKFSAFMCKVYFRYYLTYNGISQLAGCQSFDFGEFVTDATY